MKKLVLTAAMLLTLGLGVFAACAPTTEDPGHAEDPGHTEEPDEPGTQEPTNTDCGSFAETTWVSVHGTLDLDAGTYTAASDFAVTGVTGEYEETEISCTMGGAAYTLRYNNDEGRLDLYNAQDEFEYFFFADASFFSGTWYSEDDTSAYYVISSVPDEDGYFTWNMYAMGSMIPSLTERAITVFMFNEDENRTAGMFLYVPSEGYSYSFSSAGAVYMGLSESESLAVTTYTGPYSAAYRNSSGETLEIDFENSTVTYRGSTVSCSPGLGTYGSGIWFRLGEIDYALIYMGDATYLFGGGRQVAFAPYSDNWLTGSEEGEDTWSDPYDLYRFEFLSETNVRFNGNEYTMSVAMEDGQTVYRFAIGETPYTIRPCTGTSDVFTLETENSLYRGQYFRNSAMDAFMQTYSSNSDLLTVSNDGGIQVSIHSLETDTTSRYSASFIYLEDLGAIAVAYNPYGTLGNTFYLTNVNAAGIYWAIAGSNSSYAVAATYLTEDFLPTAWETVSQALGEDSTYYTSGGAEPVTMQFDQERGTVLLSGEEYYFSWGYGSIRENASGVELYLVISNEPTDPTLTQYEYWRYTVIPGAYGLDVQYAEVEVDGANAEYIGTPYWMTCVPDSLMRSLQEILFVYNGQYAQESVDFAADGTLRISEIAGGSAEELLTDVVIASYSLTISATSEGVETITVEYLLPDNTTGTLTIVDRTYLTIGNKTYSHSDLAAVTGRYYAANGDSLELTERGGLSVNGTSVTVLRIDNDVAGQITVTYRYRGVEQTAVFTAGGATVGETVYTKVTFTPARFVGTYLVGENTVTVSASMGNANSTISLTASLNGILATPSLSYADGAQVLTFSAFDPESMRRITCTMTLEGNSLTVAVGSETDTASASDWSLADFDGERTVTGSDGNTYTLTCVMKGEAPVFLLNGQVCDGYTINISADGMVTLSMSCDGVSVSATEA